MPHNHSTSPLPYPINTIINLILLPVSEFSLCWEVEGGSGDASEFPRFFDKGLPFDPGFSLSKLFGNV